MDPVSVMRKLAVLRLRETGRASDVSLGPAHLWSIYQEGSERAKLLISLDTHMAHISRRAFPFFSAFIFNFSFALRMSISLGHFSLTFEV